MYIITLQIHSYTPYINWMRQRCIVLTRKSANLEGRFQNSDNWVVDLRDALSLRHRRWFHALSRHIICDVCKVNVGQTSHMRLKEKPDLAHGPRSSREHFLADVTPNLPVANLQDTHTTSNIN